MEKEITNAKKSIGGIVIIIALILLLLISIYANIILKNELNELKSTDIIGSYICGKSEYFVFSGSDYYRYAQFEMLDYGSFELVEEHIYSLTSDRTNENTHVVLSNQTIYYFNAHENHVSAFSMFSDVPTFINVTKPDSLY